MLLAVVAIFAGVFSMLLSNWLIVPKQAFSQKYTIADKIDDNFPEPDKRYFNKDSVDPTKLITIGDNANQTPFNNGTKR